MPHAKTLADRGSDIRTSSLKDAQPLNGYHSARSSASTLVPVMQPMRSPASSDDPNPVADLDPNANASAPDRETSKDAGKRRSRNRLIS